MNRTSKTNGTTSNLRLIATLAAELATLGEQVEAKQNQLTAALAGERVTVKATATKGITKNAQGKRVFSAEVRAKIAAGQVARWKRVHAAKQGNGNATPSSVTSGEIPAGAEAVKMVAPASRS